MLEDEQRWGKKVDKEEEEQDASERGREEEKKADVSHLFPLRSNFC